jgi:hypothetical protein
MKTRRQAKQNGEKEKATDACIARYSTKPLISP